MSFGKASVDTNPSPSNLYQLMDASVGLLKSQGDSLGHVKVSYLLELE